MAKMRADIEKILIVSEEIASIKGRLDQIQSDLSNIKPANVLEGNTRKFIEEAITSAAGSVLSEAAHMNTMSEALALIAQTYQNTENAILGSINAVSANLKVVSSESSQQGTDKRKWYQKFWDWLTRKEPDDYATTTDEQEKAADNAMKKRLWQVLQDDKYSPENWDNASVDERKQILQDYMAEVIRIYGLKDVRPNINWDSNLTYSNTSATLGQYTDNNHTVTLNERVLSDRISNWDSYLLLATVSHELRHAYQHEAVKHPTDFMVSEETLKTWKNNFDHYVKPSQNYQRYRDQPVEVDARNFEVTRDGHY
ncbi:MAG: hypothetical protein IKF22_01900 [Lachnospiraceae bacterium]|nr:hypothetical protein [Lachnospiraceae bacterium]